MLGNARRWFAVSSPDLPRHGWPTFLPVAFSIFSRNRSLPEGISVRHAADKTKRHPQFKSLTLIVCATSPIPPQRLFERKKQDACLFQVTDNFRSVDDTEDRFAAKIVRKKQIKGFDNSNYPSFVFE